MSSDPLARTSEIDELFTDRLHAVLPLSPKYVVDLVNVCGEKVDEADYAPFIRFANNALEDLKNMQCPASASDKTARTALKKPSSLDILFACNPKHRSRSDPRPFVPDISITSLSATRRAHNMPSATWNEITARVDCVSHSRSRSKLLYAIRGTLNKRRSVLHSVAFLCGINNASEESCPCLTSFIRIDLWEIFCHYIVNRGNRALQVNGIEDRESTLKACDFLQFERRQCVNAGERDTIMRRWVINLMIFDQVVWIWWYDREGAIQSSGIDLLTDMPRFLVLLVAFQRFTLRDWGFILELHPLVEDAHSSDALRSSEGPFAIDYGNDVKVEVFPDELVYKRDSLVGRGSRVITGESGSTVDGQSLADSDISLVAKFSWVYSSLIPEAVLVQRALDRGAGNKALTEHMPRIFASRTFDYSTATIRQTLKLPRRTRRDIHDGNHIEVEANYSRVLRSLVCERLNPIESLQSEEFLKVFFQIERCHYEVAWNVGIQHKDPRLAHFMYSVVGEEKFGVLNDWDLSTDVLAERINSSFERTGTLPFRHGKQNGPSYWRLGIV